MHCNFSPWGGGRGTIYGEGKESHFFTLSFSFPFSFSSKLWRILNILVMFKPACCYCYECVLGLVKIKQLFKNIPQGSVLRQGVWDCMNSYLEQQTSLEFWNFILKQVQNPGKIIIVFERKMLSLSQSQRDTNHCRLLGSGPGLPSPVQYYSADSGKRKPLVMMITHQVQWLLQLLQQALCLKQGMNLCCSQLLLYTRQNNGCESQLVQLAKKLLLKRERRKKMQKTTSK